MRAMSLYQPFSGTMGVVVEVEEGTRSAEDARLRDVLHLVLLLLEEEGVSEPVVLSEREGDGESFRRV